MSCNGCRILRKGCSDDCMLRQCLQWINDPLSQANATLFVAKFFGRAGLMSFLSAVPKHHRPSLFQSLLYKAVGRTVNPVSGAVGLLWTGKWHICQTSVMTVFRGGAIHPLPELEHTDLDKAPEYGRFKRVNNNTNNVSRTRLFGTPSLKRKRCDNDGDCENVSTNLDLSLTRLAEEDDQRAATPSEESETSTVGSVDCSSNACGERKLLTLFL